jgi:MFS family permease
MSVSGSRRTVLSLLVTSAVLSQGYGAMFTLIARFRDDYGIAESRLGIVVGIGFFMSFLAQLLIAPQADKGRAKQLLLGGITANAVGMFIMTLSESFEGLLLGRVIMGLGIGAAYPAIRRAIAVAEPDRVGENTGAMLSADVFGFLMGPVIAYLVVDRFGIDAPFLVGIGFSVLAFILCIRVQVGEALEGAPRQKMALGLLRERWMQAAVLYGVAFFAMIGTFDALWALRITDLIGDKEKAGPWVQLGIVVFALPLVLFGRIGGKFVERRGPFTLCGIGLGLGVCFVSMYGLISIPAVLIAVGVVQATIDSFSASGIPVAVTQHAPPERLAGAQGLVGAFQTLTGGITSVLAGGLYDGFGPIVAYSGTSALMLICVATGFHRSKPYRDLEPLRGAAS